MEIFISNVNSTNVCLHLKKKNLCTHDEEFY